MPKSVVTLGTFDGVHRGHQKILGLVERRARRLGVASAALIFRMPPRHAKTPRKRPVLITTFAEKLELLKRYGIQKVYPLIFDRKTANTSAQDFFKKIVVRRCGAQEMVVGPKIAFGKNRTGRLKELLEFGRKDGVSIYVIPEVNSRWASISSRRIRAYLEKGKIRAVEAMLGRPFSAEGKVIHGDGRGRVLGFPTLNLEIEEDKILPPGVYWVRVGPKNNPAPLTRQDLRSQWDGLCNVGVRPTFSGPKVRHCEIFLLKPPKSTLYGCSLRVTFLKHLRGERRFPSAEALQKQIKKDLVQVKRFKL